MVCWLWTALPRQRARLRAIPDDSAPRGMPHTRILGRTHSFDEEDAYTHRRDDAARFGQRFHPPTLASFCDTVFGMAGAENRPARASAPTTPRKED